MIPYGKHLASLNIGRGKEITLQMYNKDIGPIWVSNDPVPSDDEIKKGGCVCIGLIALLLRKAKIPLPFFNMKKRDGLKFGLGATDEWLYLFKDKVQPFDEKATYPVETLLFRVWNPTDAGHVSMVIGGSGLKAKVLQTVGRSVGGNGKISVSDTVGMQHTYYKNHPKPEKPYTPPWDKKKQFTVTFDGPYYTHVLLPEDYKNDDISVFKRAMKRRKK